MSERVATADVIEVPAAEPELAQSELTELARPSCWWKRSPSTACAVSTDAAPRAESFDLDRPWQLHPQVSVRPGAVRGAALPLRHPPPVVPEEPRAAHRGRDARRRAQRAGSLRAAGLARAELPAYAAALQTLASSQMIRPREPA